MDRTLELRPALAEAATRLAPSRRYWAVVGNGPNRIAANEVRIKLSELCYKSIACDATEDKKHIDLSSEPLILVCAAGSERFDRRRRGQGDRHLPRPQGGAGGDRQRGRGALLGRHAGRAGAPHAPEPGLRAVGHGRPPVQLRGRPGHRRAGPPAARGPGRHRGACSRRARPRARRRGRPARPARSGPRAAGGAVLRRAAHRRLRRPARGQHGRAPGLAAALRARGLPARVLPGRARQGRVRRAWWSRTSPCRSPGPSTS